MEDTENDSIAPANDDGGDDEMDVCRVCRSGSEPNRPLFYPCKCSGSIKYIHQDCLLTWLSHSKVQSCELCKTKYTFTPVYAENTPSSLPVTDLVTGAFKLSRTWMVGVFRFFLTITVWTIVVPIGTSWIWKCYFSSFQSTISDISKSVSGLNLQSLANDCLFGFMIGVAIILLLMGFSSLLEYLQIYTAENRAENDRGGDFNMGPLNGVLGAFNPQNEANEAPQEIELEDFVGLSGPISKLIEKALLVLACFSAFLGITIFLPKTVGLLSLFVVDHTLAPLGEEWTDVLMTERGDLVRVIIGYVIFALCGVAWLFVSSILQQTGIEFIANTSSAIAEIVKFGLRLLKVATLLLIEGGLFPLAAGYLLDYATGGIFKTQPLFSDHVSLSERFPFISVVLHWMVGLFYMFSFAHFVSWLREILRDGVLWFFRNPNDPNFDPLKDMIELSLSKHIIHISLSAVLYGSIIFILFWGPIAVCHYVFPSVLPIDIGFRDIYEAPLDLIVFHILVPLTFDHIHPAELFKKFLKLWFQKVGGYLSLSDYLFEPTEGRQVSKPAQFGFRIFLLLFLGILTLFTLDLVFLVAPVSLGRLATMAIPFRVNDFHASIAGWYMIWGSVILTRYVLACIPSLDYESALGKTIRGSIVVGKWLLVLVPWLIFIPFLLGLLFELTVVIPIRCQITESSTFFPYHYWALGLLYLKVWFRAVMMDAYPNSWKSRFEKVKRDGFMGVDVVHIYGDLILPIMSPLLLLLCAPYAMVHSVLPLFTQSLYIQSVCDRFVYFSICLSFLTGYSVRFLVTWLPKFKQAILDEKYLIGHQLHNLDNGDVQE